MSNIWIVSYTSAVLGTQPTLHGFSAMYPPYKSAIMHTQSMLCSLCTGITCHGMHMTLLPVIIHIQSKMYILFTLSTLCTQGSGSTLCTILTALLMLSAFAIALHYTPLPMASCCSCHSIPMLYAPGTMPMALHLLP